MHLVQESHKMSNEEMTEEEFEKWKEDNGWHFTEYDFLMLVFFIAALWLAVSLG